MRSRRFLSLLLIVSTLLGAPSTVVAQPGTLDDIRALTENAEFDLALARLEDLLSRSPGDVEAMLYRGIIYTRMGRMDAAIDAFREMADEYPDRAEPHNNLAVLYASQSRYEEARESLERAVAIQPDYDTAQENLGDIYSKLASLAYERAHALNPDNRAAKEKAEVIARAFEGQIIPADAEQPPDPPAPTTEEILPVSAPEPARTVTAQDAPRPPTFPPVCHDIDAVQEPGLAARMEQWAAARGADVTVETDDRDVVVNHKIFLPPLADADAADAEVERMRARGIDDIIRITQGDLANGISLGVYGTPAGLERRMVELREMGYAVQSQPRHEIRRVHALRFAAPAADRAFASDFANAFPGHALTDAACT